MSTRYKEKIVQAFRDNAIKSVLLIDDKYLPYEKMADEYNKNLLSLSRLVQSDIPQHQDFLTPMEIIIQDAKKSFMSSQVAQKFVQYFHDKKFICDVENQTDNLDKEKIRKSDLIVLDYHLKEQTSNDAEHALNLISELSQSKHMNMVVIYTAEPLNNVWYQIAATLRGTHSSDACTFFQDTEIFNKWIDHQEDWEDEWQYITSAEIELQHLTGEHDLESLVSSLQRACEARGCESPNDKHVEWLLEKDIIKHNKNNKPLSNFHVHGKEALWLQAGDVFIALCEKEKERDGDEPREVTPEEVWEQIKNALEDWYPSFYRVVISELQNQIEDANFSMSKALKKPLHAQVSLLWSILNKPKKKQLTASVEILSYLIEDLAEELKNNQNLANFIKASASSILDPSIDRSDPKSFLTKTVEVSRSNFKEVKDSFDANFCLQIAHALNQQATTKPSLPDYITTGTILKVIAEGETNWYMCVTPSCDTVPEQKNGDNAQQLDPHRLLTFAKLQDTSLEEALKNADQSSYIFVSDDNNRHALNVVHPSSKQPNLVKFVILNHNKKQLKTEGHVVALKLVKTTDDIKTEKITMHPITQLEAHYAARYQAVQSHHEGRIGVEFFKVEFDQKIPE